LFSIVLPYIKDSVVLDLFSGTGSLGLEALSRGAKFVYLNDYNRGCNSIIKENIKKCKIDSNYKLTQLNYLKAIEYVRDSKKKIDIVFLDPPYEKGFIKSSIEKIYEDDIINIDGLIICEHGKNEVLEANIFNFNLIDRRKYGIAHIAIYKRGN